VDDLMVQPTYLKILRRANTTVIFLAANNSFPSENLEPLAAAVVISECRKRTSRTRILSGNINRSVSSNFYRPPSQAVCTC
jgi:hypothetical protein